jgi:protein involved in polysaccharide export with SLBB domain
MRRAGGFQFALAVALCCWCSASFGQDTGLPGPSAAARVPGGETVSVPVPQAAARTASAGPADYNYQLGTGDRMKVTVYGEEDLSGEFVVDGSGQVQFPLIGQVNAAGLSVHEFITELTTNLAAKYLKDPKVSVEIENYRPFYIMGEVNKPGEYPFENGLNLQGAVALAGGFTYRANDSTFYLRHRGETQESAIQSNKTTRILPGDVIRIPERFF